MRKGSNVMLFAVIAIVVVLVLLFALAKLVFWIALLVVLVLFGIWLYRYLQNRKKISTEATYGESKLH